jgi:hypothetical protein
MFNWFKKELTPEVVFEILRADAEKAKEPYEFGWENNMPVMWADDDFLEFLHEESAGTEMNLVEAAELFGIWMAENCD